MVYTTATEVNEIAEKNQCPHCEAEMEKGYVIGNKAIWWDERKPRLFRGPRVLLHGKTPYSYLPARRCISCFIIIIDIPRDAEELKRVENE